MKIGESRPTHAGVVDGDVAVDWRDRPARKEVRCLGYVVAADNRREIECVVLDLSVSGAKLRISRPTGNVFAARPNLPRTFKLVLRNDKVEVDCIARWNNGWMCGIAFTSPFRPAR